MKALSIKQPYASLIAEGIKDIENRSQKTNYRGTVLIHASATWHDRVLHGVPANLFNVAQLSVIPEPLWQGIARRIARGKEGQPLDFSAIVGQVDIVDCIQDSTSIWAEPGAWHWKLANAIKYENPILEVKGALSFWEFKPEDLERMVVKDLAAGGRVVEPLQRLKPFYDAFKKGRVIETFNEGDNLVFKAINFK